MQRFFLSVYRSFPVKLALLHLRSHWLLGLFWVLLLLMMSGNLGSRFGFQYLFLDPEYMGKTDFWSFFYLGMAMGGFIFTWNLTTYLLHSQYFPFLATLYRPFTKYCINNGVLPLFFVFIYACLIARFGSQYEGQDFWKILQHVLGMLGGAILMVLFFFIYFLYTNRDISYYLKRKPRPANLMSGGLAFNEASELGKQIAPGRRSVDLEYIKQDKNAIRVESYLNEYLVPRPVRSVSHYDSKMLMRIFRQNHFNALIIQLMSMIALAFLGRWIDTPAFRIPAAASMFILFSLLTALIGAFIYWFGTWWSTITLMLLLAANWVSTIPGLQYQNRAYGLDYKVERPLYSYPALEALCHPQQVETDRQNTLAILEKWKQKTGQSRPKLVVVCSSGGGLKAAGWTFRVLEQCDSTLQGNLLPHTSLMTGASGGMMGLSYIRQLYLEQQRGILDSTLFHTRHLHELTRDVLNPIAFSAVTNDFFWPTSSFVYSGKRYAKDRGYAFERQFNENTRNRLNRPLSSYTMPERNATIPLLFLTPSILNDGRRLIISPQGISYLMVAPANVADPSRLEIDAVDFGHLFGAKQAGQLRFLTAIRMNATYPYVLPNVHLPTSPGIEVLDAGLRDNYGISTASRFLQVFRNWIVNNTSGVILIHISGAEKFEDIRPSDNRGFLDAVTNPFDLLGKLDVFQEYEHDNSLGLLYDLYGRDRFEVVRFIYRNHTPNKLSATVSLHMTPAERESVWQAIYDSENQKSLEKLRTLFY